jgi:transcriptional regulator with XRE-family HTH domain
VSTKIVGRRIQDHRLNRGMSPEALGARVGVSGMTIRRLEDGKVKNPHVRSKFLIAQELGVDVVQLFS